MMAPISSQACGWCSVVERSHNLRAATAPARAPRGLREAAVQRVCVHVAECRQTGASTDEGGGESPNSLPSSSASPSPEEHLACHLGLHPSKLAALRERQPEVLQLPLNRLIPRMQRLAEVMGISNEQVVTMVSRHPAVLSAPPTMLVDKAREMAAKLDLKQGAVMPLLARQPEFLEVPTEKLASRCSLLASSLGVSTLDALTSLCRLPPSPLFAVLGLRPTFVPVRVVELCRLLQVGTGLPAAQTPSAAPLPDDPTLADDGSVAFTPLLMRSPLPGVQDELASAAGPDEWVRVRRNLRRAATALEGASFEAGRLPAGPGAVATMVLKCPQLLLAPMHALKASCQALLDMLQVSPSRLLRVLTRCPRLLLRAPAALHASAAALQSVLSGSGGSLAPGSQPLLTRAALAKRLLQQPQLLLLPEQDVRQRATDLTALLGWEPADVARALRSQPQLLAASAAAVAAKVPALAAALGAPRRVGDAMARRQPGLLTTSGATLAANLDGLHRALLPPPLPLTSEPAPDAAALPPRQQQRRQEQQLQGQQPQEPGRQRQRRPVSAAPSRQPQQQHWPASAPSTSCDPSLGLRAAPALGPRLLLQPGTQLHLPASGSGGSANDSSSCTTRHLQLHPGVVRAAAAQPTLLLLPPRTLDAKVGFFMRLLRADRRAACTLLLQHPLLLAIPRANLLFRLSELQMVFGLPQWATLQLLLAAPEHVIYTPPLELKRSICQALLASEPSQGQQQPGARQRRSLWSSQPPSTETQACSVSECSARLCSLLRRKRGVYELLQVMTTKPSVRWN